ncbi:hypothetical protein [Serratia fonticola]|uniref:hypothetical protein n=1 Tax=Serratia fonticola TaxID=47917 RepID=UPI000464AD71|nr:hypothetical protein [Serratia fonticola]
MTTQKDNAVGAMQDFFPNGGRDWDAINAMYEAIAAGKIPGVATGQRVADLEQRVEALHLQAVKDGNHIVELEQYKGLNLSIKENLASTIKELEQRPQQPIKLPELDSDLIDILGRPNFACIRIAKRLRELGYEIKRRSENEQAATLHFLLSHYLADGGNWRDTAEIALRGNADKVEGE